MQNLHQLFDWQYIGQIIGGDFAKFCGLLRIYELYVVLELVAESLEQDIYQEIQKVIVKANTV